MRRLCEGNIYENNHAVWPGRLKALLMELATLECAWEGRGDNPMQGVNFFKRDSHLPRMQWGHLFSFSFFFFNLEYFPTFWFIVQSVRNILGITMKVQFDFVSNDLIYWNSWVNLGTIGGKKHYSKSSEVMILCWITGLLGINWVFQGYSMASSHMNDPGKTSLLQARCCKTCAGKETSLWARFCFSAAFAHVVLGWEVKSSRELMEHLIPSQPIREEEVGPF